MKILKNILLLILALIALLLAMGFFVKKEYSVEREITINRPAEVVFQYIKHIRHQDHYSVFNKIDPNMIKSYSGADGTVGFIYAWESENKQAGKGEQEIVAIRENERIDMQLRFEKPFKSVASTYMETEALSDSSTRVTWGFEGRMPYPMNIMRLFMDIPGMMGGYFQDGLKELKTILEK